MPPPTGANLRHETKKTGGPSGSQFEPVRVRRGDRPSAPMCRPAGAALRREAQETGGLRGPHTYIVFIIFIGNRISIPLILPHNQTTLGLKSLQIVMIEHARDAEKGWSSLPVYLPNLRETTRPPRHGHPYSTNPG
jgi:hypothetical protein